MEFGVVLPRTAIGADVRTVTEYARTVEEAGYHYLLAYDHVLGASPARPGDGYDRSNPIHEPLVLFGYLAGMTERIELVTGILILPQRQTALVAKQAAEVDVLSEGRLRLGVGVGWNDVEFEALGVDFRRRGARIEEQIDVLRQLWTNELVTYEGAFHTITDAGLNPLPLQQPIPIWMGGNADAVLERAGRVADGWLPYERDPEKVAPRLDRLREYAEAAGREPSELAILGRIPLRAGNPGDWIEDLHAWADLGCTHCAVTTMNAGHAAVDDHRAAIREFVDRAVDAGFELRP